MIDEERQERMEQIDRAERMNSIATGSEGRSIEYHLTINVEEAGRYYSPHRCSVAYDRLGAIKFQIGVTRAA
jgi:hypothetical protein